MTLVSADALFGSMVARMKLVIEACPVNPPTMPRPQRLPFQDLGWRMFEMLTADIATEVLGHMESRLHGRQGQKDYGVDVVVQSSDGGYLGFQSKCVNKFDPKDLADAIREFAASPPLGITSLTIFVAQEGDHTGLDAELETQRKKFGHLELEVWYGKKISGMLRNQPRLVARYFGDTWAEVFCDKPPHRSQAHQSCRDSGWHFGGTFTRSRVVRLALGLRSGTHSGDLFTGRERAVSYVRDWLTLPTSPGRPLVITGRPGAGKSSVAARAVIDVQAAGSTRGLAFHSHGQTHAQLVTAIAESWCLPSISDRDELVDAVAEASAVGPVRVIFVDGLDEALNEDERREICYTLVELARIPAFRVAIATRPLEAGADGRCGGYLADIGISAINDGNLVDLDSDGYFDSVDLKNFVAKALTHAPKQDSAPPRAAWAVYRDQAELRESLADVIARRAGRNYLVASMTAHQLANAEHAVDPSTSDFNVDTIPTGIGAALASALRSLPLEMQHLARGLLTALAYDTDDGLDTKTWLCFAAALGYVCTAAHLDLIRGSAAVDFLVETTDGRRSSRLFHQALIDELLAGRDRESDCSAILDALSAQPDWTSPTGYAKHYAVDFALASNRLDVVLNDPGFLAVADIERILALAPSIPTPVTAAMWAVLRQATDAGTRSRSRRVRLLALSAAHLGLHDEQRAFAQLNDERWAPGWAQSLGTPHQIVAGHRGGIYGLAIARIDGEDVIVSGGTGGEIFLHDAVSGGYIDQWPPHSDCVNALSVGRIGGAPALATVGNDGTVRISDLDSGTVIHEFGGTPRGALSAAIGRIANRDVVAIGGTTPGLQLVDAVTGSVLWEADFESSVEAVFIGVVEDREVVIAAHRGYIAIHSGLDGTVVRAMPNHREEVMSMTICRVGQRDLIVTGCLEKVQVADANSRDLLMTLECWGKAVATWSQAERSLLVVGNSDGKIKIYDLETGELHEELSGHSDCVMSVAVGQSADRRFIVSGSDDGMIRIFDLGHQLTTARPIDGHPTKIKAVAAGCVEGRDVVVTGDEAGSLRVFDAASGRTVAVVESLLGIVGLVLGCLDGMEVVVCGGFSGDLKVFDAKTLQVIRDMSNANWHCVLSLAVASIDGKGVVVVGTNNGRTYAMEAETGCQIWEAEETAATLTVTERVVAVCGNHGVPRILDLADGRLLAGITGLPPGSYALASAVADGQQVIVTGGPDGAVRLHESNSGALIREIVRHSGYVHTLSIGQSGGRSIVVSGGYDATVKVTDTDGEVTTAQDVVDVVTAVASTAGGGVFVASGRALFSLSNTQLT